MDASKEMPESSRRRRGLDPEGLGRDRLLSRLMSGKIDVEDLDIQFPPSMNSPNGEESEAPKYS